MMKSTKESSHVERLANRQEDTVHDDENSLGRLVYLNAKGTTGMRQCENCTTLCFIRGTGRIAIKDASVAYHDGKWFEIPGGTSYQIFPDTNTVVLTIQNSSRLPVDVNEERFLRRFPSRFRRSLPGRTERLSEF